jgi:hypothetical protein
VETTWKGMLLALIPVVVGAGLGVLPAIFLDRWRASAALRIRWDQTLQTVCAKFAACARRIIDISENIRPDLPPGRLSELEREIDVEHRALQELMAEVRLLGDKATQAAARHVVRDSWALRTQALTGNDPQSANAGGVEPRTRTLNGLLGFYLAARRQLRVPGAGELEPLNPPFPSAVQP